MLGRGWAREVHHRAVGRALQGGEVEIGVGLELASAQDEQLTAGRTCASSPIFQFGPSLAASVSYDESWESMC